MRPKTLAVLCAHLADSKKAKDVVVLDVKPNPITDYFVIVSGESDIQRRAIADAVIRGTRETGKKLLGKMEGYKKAEWVLLDFGDAVVHIFSPSARLFYDLDGFWGDAPKIEWQKHQA